MSGGEGPQKVLRGAVGKTRSVNVAQFVLFHGGIRGKMDARKRPFGSHGVPLGSALGHKRQLRWWCTMFCCFSGRSKHITESAPRPLRYEGRGRRRPFCFSLIVLFCFRRRSRRRTNSAPRPLSYRVRGRKSHVNKVFLSSLLLRTLPTQGRGPTKARPRLDHPPYITAGAPLSSYCI